MHRVASEHATLKRPTTADNEPPRKRRRLPRGVQGVYAQDMSLVTPENAESRGGWRVTALGRLVRPIRMPPEHPLPDPIPVAAKSGKLKKTSKEKTPRKRMRDPLTRARRRTIDPMKWGSQLVTGAFLEGGVSSAGEGIQFTKPSRVPAEEPDSQSEDEEDQNEQPGPEAGDAIRDTSRKPPPAKVLPTFSFPVPGITLNTEPLESSGDIDLAMEMQKSLGLLQALFGDRGDEWGGEESIGSDVGVDVDVQDCTLAQDEDPKEHEQPMDVDEVPVTDGQDVVPVMDGQDVVRTRKSTVPSQPQAAKLKDLFAPREEDSAYTVLNSRCKSY